MDELSWEVMAKIDDFGNQDLSNTSWAFAKLGVANAMMMGAIGKKMITMVRDLIPQDLANTAWAFATLGLPDSDLMDEILMEVIAKVNDFATQNIANTAWAFAKLGLWNERLMETLAHATVRKIRDFDAQGLANIAWSYAVLGFKSEKLNEAIMRATIEKIEAHDFDTQELANVAWSWDVTHEKARLGQYLWSAIPAFIELEHFTDCASWTDFANIVALRGESFRGSERLAKEFKERFYQPSVQALQDVLDPDKGEGLTEVVDALDAEVKRIGLTNFGFAYTRQAFRDLGFKVADQGKSPAWVDEARALAKGHLEEWRIPGTENILAVCAYELWHENQKLSQDLTVVTSGWAEGVHDEVKALLRPVDARGWSCESYCERVALLELVEAARNEFGEECLDGLSGWVRLYHTHHTSVSGMGMFCQFRRQAPGVQLELDFDSAWYTWGGEPRTFTVLSDKEESLFYYS